MRERGQLIRIVEVAIIVSLCLTYVSLIPRQGNFFARSLSPGSKANLRPLPRHRIRQGSRGGYVLWIAKTDGDALEAEALHAAGYA